MTSLLYLIVATFRFQLENDFEYEIWIQVFYRSTRKRYILKSLTNLTQKLRMMIAKPFCDSEKMRWPGYVSRIGSAAALFFQKLVVKWRQLFHFPVKMTLVHARVLLFGRTRTLRRCLHWEIFLATCLAILLWHKLHEPLRSVTCPELNKSRNCFVAATVARSRSWFYFVQRRLQQKRCETCSFQGMLHYATIRATCVATAQRDCETSCKENCPV